MSTSSGDEPVEIPRRLLALVIEAVSWPPIRGHRYASSAAVPWRLIEDIRAELEDGGVDWRRTHHDLRRAEREAAETLTWSGRSTAAGNVGGSPPADAGRG